MSLSDLANMAETATSYLAVGLIVIGLYFLFAAALGMLRLPDVYTRSHAVSLTDSLGALFVLGGLALYQLHQGFNFNSGTNLVKIVLVLVLLYLLNPVIAHATVRSALRSGLKPWSREPSSREPSSREPSSREPSSRTPSSRKEA